MYCLVCMLACVWLFSATGFVVDGAAVAEHVLDLGCSFLVRLSAAQLFGLSLGMLQPDDSEKQDQEHVSTSVASLKYHCPEDALYLFIANLINRRKEECSFYVKARLNLNR